MDKVKVTLKGGEELIAYGGSTGIDGRYYFYLQNHYMANSRVADKETVVSVEIIENNSTDMSDIKPIYHVSVPPDKRI